jgi:hypothetical protein
MTKQVSAAIKDDLIIGGPNIANELGIPYRQLTYLASTGQLGDAIKKLGPKKLIASRTKLRTKLGLADETADTSNRRSAIGCSPPRGA